MFDPGSFRERISLQSRSVVSDGYGNEQSGDWAPQFSRAAMYLMKPGSETMQAARLQSQQPVNMIVRFDPQTRTITPEWRAVDERTGVAYAIRAIEDMDRRRQWLTLVCVAGEVA